MEFVKYQHIERFGTTEVENINIGTCYIFPKIDGTNGSIWLGDNLEIHAGSRNRELSTGSDNAGFYLSMFDNSNIKKFFAYNPNLRLYGEWLVPHSLKTYQSSAWNKFYVFDVMDGDEYLTYDEYKPILETYNIEYIPCVKIIENPSYEALIKIMNSNNYLVKDGEGIGEGIVIKNYDYTNKYGRKTWAKMVSSEFRTTKSKVMGPDSAKGKDLVEEKIVNEYITEALCEKVKAKIELENNGFSSKNIPQYLNIVYYDLIREESWNFIKKFKNPTINYSTLKYIAFNKAKEYLNI